jgi:hypothetical protein
MKDYYYCSHSSLRLAVKLRKKVIQEMILRREVNLHAEIMQYSNQGKEKYFYFMYYIITVRYISMKGGANGTNYY